MCEWLGPQVLKAKGGACGADVCSLFLTLTLALDHGSTLFLQGDVCLVSCLWCEKIRESCTTHVVLLLVLKVLLLQVGNGWSGPGTWLTNCAFEQRPRSPCTLQLAELLCAGSWQSCYVWGTSYMDGYRSAVSTYYSNQPKFTNILARYFMKCFTMNWNIKTLSNLAKTVTFSLLRKNIL